MYHSGMSALYSLAVLSPEKEYEYGRLTQCWIPRCELELLVMEGQLFITLKVEEATLYNVIVPKAM